MNYDLLNNMINYIEDNLTEDIDYNSLAKIVGISEYSLQRIFTFLTNISISEYIRKRRLSKAFEELKASDIKILDLAIKYNYDSSISFSRAFKQYFGITPSECKKSEKHFKLFPIISFHNNNYLCNELNYEIKEVGDKEIYCFFTEAGTNEDLLFNIRKLYNDLKDSGIHAELNKIGMYGISLFKDNKYFYYVGSKKNYNGTKTITIPKSKYAIFDVGSREQKDIVETENLIYNQWIKSTNYEISNEFNFELYNDDNCYLYIPIKDKQN